MKNWKDVKGMEGRYQIADDGSIRILPHYAGGRRLPMKVLDLKYQEVQEIKRRLAAREHPYHIAETMGISRKVVSKIKSGRSYAWINS